MPHIPCTVIELSQKPNCALNNFHSFVSWLMHVLLRTKLLYYTNLFECQKSSFCSWCRHFSMDCMCTSLYSKSSNLNKWGCDNNTGVDFRLYQDGLPLFKTAQYGPKNNIGHALYYIGHIYRLHLLKYYNATAEWCRYSHKLVSDIEHRIWLCKDIDIVLKVQCVAYKINVLWNATLLTQYTQRFSATQ